jgi:hypothetical protein
MDNKISAFINMVSAGWAYLELLDELKGTDVYKHGIKQQVNKLTSDLEKSLDKEIALLWGRTNEEDDKVLYNIINAWKATMVKFRDIKPEYIPPINEIIDLLITNPDHLLDIVRKHWPDQEITLKAV